MSLHKMKCEACEGGIPKLSPKEVRSYFGQLSGWKLEKGRLVKRLEFKNFLEAMRFVNKLARLAEKEQHHPDFNLYSWNKLDVTIYTHSIKGLSKNDFILAAKIDGL
ncbi:MAG: 4a-hydroxytetrahydrobiopterin dehydratase [Bdellovibrionota bacterium]